MAAPNQPYPDEPPAAAAEGTAGAGARPKRSISAGQLLGGLLFVLVIVFIIENSRQVKIRLIGPEVKAPLYVAILISAVLGALIAWLLRYRRHRRHPTR